MRLAVVLPILLLFALPLPVHAQGPLTTLVSEDDGDDVQVHAGDAATETAPEDRFEGIDLRSVSVTETADAFHFSILVDNLQTTDDEAPYAESGYVTVDFNHEDQGYRIFTGRVYGDSVWYFGLLLRAEEGSSFLSNEGYAIHSAVDFTVDEADGLYNIAVERNDLYDQNGAPPFPGRTLTDFAIRSETYFRNPDDYVQLTGLVDTPEEAGVFWAEDDMEGGQDVPVQLGLQQTGHARLYAEEPARASNGEATTFVFEIEAENVGSTQDLFTLSATGLPNGWEVTLPQPTVSLAAGERVTLPVVLSTPFAHKHGDFEEFVMEMTSTSDPDAVGRVGLGIRYLTIPQPAGHHDLLSIHSRSYDQLFGLRPVLDQAWNGNSGWLYMNALDEDAFDEDVPIAARVWGFSVNGDGPRGNYRWHIFLNPGLQMGLDFNLERLGELAMTISHQTPLLDAKLTGRLVLLGEQQTSAPDEGWPYGQRELTDLAYVEPVGPQDMGGASQTDFVTPMVPTEESDYIPYKEGQTMVLELNINYLKPNGYTGAEAPRLQPGATLQLPLNEYRDKVDDLFTTLTGVSLTAAEQEKVVNPGESVLFDLQAKNDLDHEAPFTVRLSGINKEWATLVGPSSFDIPSGGSKELQVAVAAPENARDLEAADVVVEIIHDGETSTRSLVRLVATVDSSVDVEDASAQVAALDNGEKESPGLPLVLLLAGIVALVIRRRW